MNPVVLLLKPGEILFKEGDACNGVYIVKQGDLEVFREKDGTSIVLATMHPGDVIGTATIFSRESRTACARAHTAAQVVHVCLDTVEGSFKNLPIWVQAVLKDSVARLKSSNDQLLEAKLQERKLQQKAGTKYHFASQFSAFLGFAIRSGLVKDEGIELFPLKGVVERCESILQKRSDYLEKILDAFVKGSLVKIQPDKKWGRSIYSPNAALMEDFGNFVLQCAKTEGAGFVPTKHQLLMSSLVRLAKKPDFKEYYTKAEFIEMLSKESGKSITNEILEEFVKLRLVASAAGADKLSWSAVQIQKRLIFESTVRFVKDVRDEESENKAA
ncbi:MAG: Crp/Fnr family transcriptional regulator [Silvanigrellaceae bacterium]